MKAASPGARTGSRWSKTSARSGRRPPPLPFPSAASSPRHALGPDTIRTVTAVIRDSLAHARRHREETVPTMRRYAQELSGEVMFQHVDLYVNDWTTDLGDTGRAAIETLDGQARRAGLGDSAAPPLRVY